MYWTPKMGFTMPIWRAFLVPSYWWNTIIKPINLFFYIFHQLAWILFAVSLYTTVIIPEIIPPEITQSITGVIGISELTTITKILCFAVFFVICIIAFFLNVCISGICRSISIQKSEHVVIPDGRKCFYKDAEKYDATYPPFNRHISTPESMYETIPDRIKIEKYPRFEISYE